MRCESEKKLKHPSKFFVWQPASST